jgi:hypothetical protein
MALLLWLVLAQCLPHHLELLTVAPFHPHLQSLCSPARARLRASQEAEWAVAESAVAVAALSLVNFINPCMHQDTKMAMPFLALP